MDNRRILMYGVKQQAEQLKYYIESEGKGTVVAFVVDKEYKEKLYFNEKFGLPIVTFENAIMYYPPTDYEMCVSLAYQHLVHDREEKLKKSKEAGYKLFQFISDKSICYAEIGEGNIIYPGCILEYGVKVGDGNFFEMGAKICHHTTIADYNFFAPGSVILGGSCIRSNNFFGANSVVIGKTEIEGEVIVGATAVTKKGERGKVYLPERTTEWHDNSKHLHIR